MKAEGILKEKGYQVHTVHVDGVVADALRIMADKHVGALIVVDSAKSIQGIISERDVIRHCDVSQANVKGLPVREVMTVRENLVVSGKDDDIGYLMDVMTEKRVRHIPIVDPEGKLVGIVSVGDVVKALMTSKEHEIKYLKDYIESKYPA